MTIPSKAKERRIIWRDSWEPRIEAWPVHWDWVGMVVNKEVEMGEMGCE